MNGSKIWLYNGAMVWQTATPGSAVVKHVLSHICCILAISGTNEKHTDDGYHVWSHLLQKKTPTKQTNWCVYGFLFCSAESSLHKYTIRFTYQHSFMGLCCSVIVYEQGSELCLWNLLVLLCGIYKYCFKEDILICRCIWSIVQFSPQV